MLVGQQFGPFTIDKELGSGAMGTVYLGRYTKSGQVMAVKIMAPGIGSTNAVAVDRFEREIAILKQLNHPNIVRFYGAGKQQGMRYFAMEFIDGESLDRVMARRGRMTWEEVVELGKQLCAALQHAHEKGIIHRDLKPSNIMVLPDGTLKLTDFGIAKDMTLEGLTATNCTVGTASYMSPEQCKGERNLTNKSDLYSLGVMIYELVTGKKPFAADNAMEMFMEHVNGKFERPSRLVLDIPVWLDTLICQLLEKKPEQRPLDARMVANTLGTIQEKVEAQQSAGVDALRRRAIDRPPGQKRLTEEDKDAAHALLTGKGRPKRKQMKKPFHEKVWFRALGLTLALAVAVTLLYLALRGPSADKLYQQAKAVMQSGNDDKKDEAIEPGGVIAKFLATSSGKQDNEKSREVRGWREQIQVAQNEKLLEKHLQRVRDNKPRLNSSQEDETKKSAFDAVEAEEKGDRQAAFKRWQTVKKLEEDSSAWARVADKHLAEWSGVDQIDKEFEQMYKRIHNSGEEPKLSDERQREAFLAWRMEKSDVGNRGLAKSMFESLWEKRKKEPGPRQRWYLFAAWNTLKLKDAAPADMETQPSDIQKILNETRAKLDKSQIRPLDAKLLCLDVLALYGQNESMSKVVEEAQKFLPKINP